MQQHMFVLRWSTINARAKWTMMMAASQRTHGCRSLDALGNETLMRIERDRERERELVRVKLCQVLPTNNFVPPCHGPWVNTPYKVSPTGTQAVSNLVGDKEPQTPTLILIGQFHFCPIMATPQTIHRLLLPEVPLCQVSFGVHP